MRLEKIVSQYDGVYIDEIDFNGVNFELEIDLWSDGISKEKFIQNCNEIKEELESIGYKCTYDDEYSEKIYRLYIII